VGCAAAFRDSKATIHVASAPQGATVEFEGNVLGETPSEVLVPRQGVSVLQVKKPGYEQGHFTLQRHISTGWLLGDLATCVIPVALCIPLLVDGVTGAWMNVEPEYSVSLQPQAAPPAAPLPAAPAPPPAATSPLGPTAATASP